MSTAPANDPPRPLEWLWASILLADGTLVELRLPRAVAASASVYRPEPGEVPSLTVERGGQRRRARLGQLFWGPA